MRYLSIIFFFLFSFCNAQISSTIGTLPGIRVKLPHAIGIINNDNFSTNTIGDYSTSFVTGSASVSGGDLNLAGGNALWTNDYVGFNKSGSAYIKTCLNSWTQTITFKCTTTPSGTSYGFGIGILSTNVQTHASLWAWLRMDNGNPGKLLINCRSSGANNFVHTSSGVVRVQLNDEYSVTVTVSDNTISYTVINITNGNQTFTGAYNFVFTAGAAVMNNTGRFAICLLGGSQNIHDWNISSTGLIQDSKTAFVGNSITYGAYAGSSTARYEYVLMTGSPNMYTINSGSGDYTQSVLERVPEIIALNPTYVVLMIGGNDILYGISSVTWQANYSSIVSQLKAVGIKIVHCYTTPRNSIDVTPVNTFIAANFSGDTIVDTYTPLWSGVGTGLAAASNSGDGVHPNATGMNLIATAINTTAPFVR